MSRERPTKVEDNNSYFTFSLSNFIVVRSTDNTKQHNTILYYTMELCVVIESTSQ